MHIYVGAYTNPPLGRADGISLLDFDQATGALTHLDTFPGVENPSFLALSNDGTRLYSVGEGDGGIVAAWERDPANGKLTLLNTQPTFGGPCYVSLNAEGTFLFAANYGGGSVAAFPVNDNGTLEPASSVVEHEGSSVNPDRQEGPHAHMIAPTPNGDYILATDLGTDEVIAYTLNSDGKLDRYSEFDIAPGSGPRHFAFGDGTLYVLNELLSTLTVLSFTGDPATMLEVQTVPSLPEDFTGQSTCAEVVLSPDGKFVYGSNRGHDSIAVWKVTGDDGSVTRVEHTLTGGQEPRNFNIDPSGKWLLAANQNSDTIVVFERDAETGMLTQTDHQIASPTPVCVLFAGS